MVGDYVESGSFVLWCAGVSVKFGNVDFKLGVVAMLGGGKMEGFQATCPLAGYTCPLYEKKIFDASFMQNVSKK